ncbi:MAG: pilus (MSHA type) biogenesis protein MshL [Deltaproteobacteria bacterium]|nr:pilus (MSHA type) biogenesis protein MshL [Deltaproteobacteria bacterium]
MGKDELKTESRRVCLQKTSGYSLFPFFLFCCFIIGCASADIRREVKIPTDVAEIKPVLPPPEIKTPAFVPVSEEISPLKTRLVSIAARNTPLRDVLYVVAEAAGMNLAMEKDVLPESPVTMTLKDVTAENALNTILTGVDYFYLIKENMLIVKATDTKIFEIGHPGVTQSYATDIGGDILSGSSSPGGISSIKGNISQSTKGDAAVLNFWDIIEKSLSSIISGTGASLTGGAEARVQSVIINKLTGTIIVTAAKKNLERVEQYLAIVKNVMNRQVMIEARIIEVQLSDGFKYGIDWNAVGRWTNAGSTLTLETTKFSNVVSATLPTFKIGITGGDVTALLNALQQQGEVRTLSNPRVNIMNGQTSLLSVGRTTNFISKVTSTTTTAAGAAPTTTFAVETGSILSGVMLGIVPYINEYGEISMTVTPIVSNLVKLNDETIGSGADATKLSLPIVDLRELSTTVKIKDGQVVVIGGLISKEEKLSNSQVPFLSNIPLIGHLFKSMDKSEGKTELVVILKPVIVSN